MQQDLKTVIATWIRHAREHRKDDFWAWDWVMMQVSGDAPAEDAWTIVVDLVRAAPDDLLGFIGAGPVEDLVNRYGVELIDWIEGEARRDPRFREALASIGFESKRFRPISKHASSPQAATRSSLSTSRLNGRPSWTERWNASHSSSGRRSSDQFLSRTA